MKVSIATRPFLPGPASALYLDPMKSNQLTAAREYLRMDREALARAMGVAAWKLRLWEMGLLPVPRADARQVAVFVALQDTEEFQKRRGMRCKQMAAWDAQPDHEDPTLEEAFLDEVARHMKECRTCLAVEKYKNDRIEEILRAG